MHWRTYQLLPPAPQKYYVFLSSCRWSRQMLSVSFFWYHSMKRFLSGASVSIFTSSYFDPAPDSALPHFCLICSSRVQYSSVLQWIRVMVAGTQPRDGGQTCQWRCDDLSMRETGLAGHGRIRPETAQRPEGTLQTQ
jgi:hypothetical protein